jgi:hypothetical protein
MQQKGSNKKTTAANGESASQFCHLLPPTAVAPFHQWPSTQSSAVMSSSSNCLIQPSSQSTLPSTRVSCITDESTSSSKQYENYHKRTSNTNASQMSSPMYSLQHVGTHSQKSGNDEQRGENESPTMRPTKQHKVNPASASCTSSSGSSHVNHQSDEENDGPASWSMADLKMILSGLGLPVDGDKRKLVQRLMDSQKRQSDERHLPQQIVSQQQHSTLFAAPSPPHGYVPDAGSCSSQYYIPCSQQQQQQPLAFTPAVVPNSTESHLAHSSCFTTQAQQPENNTPNVKTTSDLEASRRKDERDAEIRHLLELFASDYTCDGHISPFFEVQRVLGLGVVRQGEQCEIEFAYTHSDIEQGLECHIVPLTFELRPAEWMQPVDDVCMRLMVNSFPVEVFPDGWRRRKNMESLFKTALRVDVSGLCDCEQPTQTLRVQFSKTDVHVWQGVMAVLLVRPVYSEELVRNVLLRDDSATQGSGITSGRKLCGDYEDPDVADDVSLQIIAAETITLMCPLTYQRIKIPTKGKNCQHMTCFDLETYLEVSRTQNFWNCPICLLPCGFLDLRIDPFLYDIVHSVEYSKMCTVMLDLRRGSFELKDPCSDDEDEDNTNGKNSK